MIKKSIIIIVLIQAYVFPQNLDSLYNRLLGLKHTQNPKENSVQSVNIKPEKCGFGLIGEIKEHINEFSLEKQNTIEKILARPTLQKSIVSPSGIFRIHFDTTGSNIPSYISGESINYNINELAVAFDSAYNYEINILGYLAPPKDGTEGGDDKYDVYVSDIRDYGFTTTDASVGDNMYTSHIQIDNSFSTNEGYNTYGILAARATAAHEFHHSIQMGNYILNFDDRYYHELTSTAMEEAVYDEVNDYYFYISSFFNNTSQTFIQQSGYNLALWNIFLRESFGGNAPNTGDKIIKRSWELMASPHNNRGIIALAKAMNEFGYSFKHELNKFATWIYFTNNRTKENEYFEEAENYPLVKETSTTDLKPTNMPLTINSKPISINYSAFLDDSQGLPDTIVAVLSNSDVEGAATANSNFDFYLTLATSSFEGANNIADSYYSKIEGSSNGFLSDSYIINNELASTFQGRNEIDFAYPQPFRYQSKVISIPTYSDISGKAELYIYSTDMNLVYSSKKDINNSGNIVVTWEGLSSSNDKLASGVYIYVTKADGKIKKGKIVILNE